MKVKLLVFIYLLITVFSFAQPKWKQTESVKEVKLELFHGTQTANFPTTESLDEGSWMYEISHRFSTPINDGIDALYGFDGPARIRFSLGYGITDDLMVNFGRSNLTDNYDLQFKQKLFQLDNEFLPSVFSVLGGVALNTEVPQNIDRGKADIDNFQFYAQLVYNGMLFDKKLGIGLVPSYLYNSFIYAVDKQYSFTFGTYIQYYFNRAWSIWLEHNAIVTGYQGKIRLDETTKSFNTLGFGVALETGGHIFNIIVTNNARLNSSQFLVGADRTTNSEGWRLGFGIIRYF
ncbi:MAG: hypothetical protein KDC88_13875 [Ignavibacteriae bacterium]|nr:hypothetical protein [Ignavibacteriota bacterium]MCB9208065.1 hypothetical protein [Ignavibacteriales bacterium]MCB9258831.1 hypothetical protein [Ignavibacteriales bacterium]